MGALRFYAPPPDQLSRRFDAAYVVDYDQVPRRTKVQHNGTVLLVEFEGDESVKLRIPWNVDDTQSYMLSTCSLRPRVQPYHLALEVARGVLSRLKSLVAVCDAADIHQTEEFYAALGDAIDAFTIAATSDHYGEVSQNAAFECIGHSALAFAELTPVYRDAAIDFIQEHAPHRTFLYGVNIRNSHPSADASALLRPTFNTAVVTPVWKDCEPNEGRFDFDKVKEQIRWCRSQGMRVVGGPVANLDELNVPDWLYLWDGDFSNIYTFQMQFVETATRNLNGMTDLWYCSSGINTTRDFHLSEEQQLRLLVGSIETMRRNDPQTPVLVSFDHPWGDYLSHSNRDLSPIHFAEEIVRANLGVTGVGVELNFNDCEGAIFPRDPFEVVRLLDQWGMLGLPLFVTLTFPSSRRFDKRAARQISNNKSPVFPISRRRQRQYVESLVPLILSHPQTQAVFWNQFTDATPHAYPNAGLFDRRDRPKSTLRSLREIRQHYLT
ncbi:hypothetical protein [Blastopirellula marina]|uniref:Glycoside hydrolase family 42 N-terminal domain-containing protein n=1 Tax=Blastopirellula marina TaxID=124 RepID=A0A2S8GG11_9BACT|nr:hypothetical protein [Blastopirellula marina]PQO43389.1 hypothetical protein C5Y98_00295 [Blastopirellula marina]PTL46703.1 hypothetical protein C5Y97_00295 [Blastopirellula marina]